MNKRLCSFCVSLALMAVLVGCTHIVGKSIPLRTDNPEFGTWYNVHKDVSYQLLSQNLQKDTVLLLGSSEFRHGRKTAYHPCNFFFGSKTKLLSIGGPFNQILFHTIVMGALEPELKSRKVILLVSPTWFKRKGVNPDDYALRFSQTEYLQFMANDNIPETTKRLVAKRSEKLLRDNRKYHMFAKDVNRHYLGNKEAAWQKKIFKIRRQSAFERDRISAGLVLKLMQKPSKAHKGLVNDLLTEKSWKKLMKDTSSYSRIRAKNPMVMSDKSWNRKFKQIYKNSYEKYPRRINMESSEFEDLELFLQVCRSCHLDAKLIILPVNGKWFDHIGTGIKKRIDTADRIVWTANSYGVECVDLTRYEYTPFFTRDAVHPWDIGWLIIDKEIYEFCNQPNS